MAKTWVFLPNLPVGLFYHVSYDMAIPFNVCGGMQDNYDWCGPSAVRGAAGIANDTGRRCRAATVSSCCRTRPTRASIYSESQDGNMVRVDRVTFETIVDPPAAGPGRAEPALALGHAGDRFRRTIPKVIYAAANKVFRSADRGLSWTAISPDLTTGANRDDIVTMGVKGSEITHRAQ